MACEFQRAIMNHRQTDVENGMVNELCEDDNEMISRTPGLTTACKFQRAIMNHRQYKCPEWFDE